MNRATGLLLSCVMCVALFCGARPSGAARVNKQASDILAAAGVRGGLVIHVGCGDGRLTAALRVNDSYLVHGLDADQADVNEARQYIRDRGLTGKVSVAHWGGERLPYVDNLVQLLVVQERQGLPMKELMRVLAPHGVAYVRENGEWTKKVKPRPQNIDEWTHFLHGADNNAVGKDTVAGQPFHLQWVGSPKWARHHNYLASVSAVVSSGGRLFKIVDEGPTHSVSLPPKWRLVARDAFSGVVLWKRKIHPWAEHLRTFRSGPPEVKRRLVAVDDRAYVTPGYGKPVVALDAATGETVHEYRGTDGTEEIIYHEGVLYLVIGDRKEVNPSQARRRGAVPQPHDKQIRALEADTGKVLWSKQDADTGEVLPMTLCVRGKRAYFNNLSGIVCLDAESGQEVWNAPMPSATQRMGWSTPTLVAQDGVVLCADRAGPETSAIDDSKSAQVEWKVSSRPTHVPGELVAFSAEDGQRLWSCPTAPNYNAPPDVVVSDGPVSTRSPPGRNDPDYSVARDLYTGEVRRRIETGPAFTKTHHHRCYRDKATSRYIFVGRTGVEFIDLEGEDPLRHCWIRGGCQYGVMPANGLLYLPPHSCACYIQSKLTGFNALAPRRRAVAPPRENQDRLERGPAYDSPMARGAKSRESEWPTFRHDSIRSSFTKSEVPAELQNAWNTRIGGDLTAPVVADGVMCVAAVDSHTVHALDASTGEQKWSFTAGGRIDSPPTLYRGRAYFGCADGWVYCLRLSDGELVWRFRAAPQDWRAVAYGQVESVWPVTGSVLIHDGSVYCTAGRSSYLDGGMYLYRLDPKTGEELLEKRFYRRDPQTGAQPEDEVADVELPGALPDVLASDGENIFLRDKRLSEDGEELPHTVSHVYSSVGFLDDSWWHRTYWIQGTQTFGRAAGWWVVANYVPSGRIMVFDDSSVYGYGRKRVRYRGRGLKDVPYRFYGASRDVEKLDKTLKNHRNVALARRFQPTKVNYHWQREVPLVMRAMVLAGDTLFAAGPPMDTGKGAEEPPFDAGPGVLVATNPETGETVADYEMEAQPVFDGIAAANGRLYICTVDGRVRCLAGR